MNQRWQFCSSVQRWPNNTQTMINILKKKKWPTVCYGKHSFTREDPIIIPEPLDVFWPITGFQQLAPEHKPMPQLTYLQIEQYFLSRMTEDKQITSDLKAFEKGNDLLITERLDDTHIYLSDTAGADTKGTGYPLISH